jgi:hypothetical protein
VAEEHVRVSDERWHLETGEAQGTRQERGGGEGSREETPDLALCSHLGLDPWPGLRTRGREAKGVRAEIRTAIEASGEREDVRGRGRLKERAREGKD